MQAFPVAKGCDKLLFGTNHGSALPFEFQNSSHDELANKPVRAQGDKPAKPVRLVGVYGYASRLSQAAPTVNTTRTAVAHATGAVLLSNLAI